MKRAGLFLLIFASFAGCITHVTNESASNAETILHDADSLERTTQPYTDTAALQSALHLFMEQGRTCEVAKTYYHLGNAYNYFDDDSLAFAAYEHAADMFLVLSDSLYYPLSILEMSLIAERLYQTDGNATMLQAIRTIQQKMILDHKENYRWKSLWWVLLIIFFAGVGVMTAVIRRRKPTVIVPVTLADLERNIELVLSQGNIPSTLHWHDYKQFCKTANAYLYNIVDKLQSEEPQLTEQDIRFLVLVILDLPAKEIAEIMLLSQNSISNKKTRTAQKLGTTAADLRETIINITLKTTKQ